MLWTQADWSSIPLALSNFSAIQEWEAASIITTNNLSGIHWVDVMLLWVAQSSINLYLSHSNNLLTLTPRYTANKLAKSFALDLAWTVKATSSSTLQQFYPKLSKKQTAMFDVISIQTAAIQQWLDSFVCNVVPAQMYTSVINTTPTWITLIQSVDPILLLLELFLVSVVCFGLDRWVVANNKQLFYDDIVTLCKYNNISLTEVAVTTTLIVGFIFFDIFVSFAEDDVVDTLNYLILIFVILTFVFLLIAVDVQYFFMISNAGGDITFRVICFDLINNLLCALRVFFCWIRYIFYDLQVELVDMTFQYTDSVNEVTLLAWFDSFSSNTNTNSNKNYGSLWSSAFLAIWLVVATFVDITLYIVQALTGLFKLVIASFLLWLIVDLFLLRGFALEESNGFAAAKTKKTVVLCWWWVTSLEAHQCGRG